MSGQLNGYSLTVWRESCFCECGKMCVVLLWVMGRAWDISVSICNVSCNVLSIVVHICSSSCSRGCGKGDHTSWGIWDQRRQLIPCPKRCAFVFVSCVKCPFFSQGCENSDICLCIWRLYIQCMKCINNKVYVLWVLSSLLLMVFLLACLHWSWTLISTIG